MKLIGLLTAGALAAGTMVAAVPADAQRYGYHHEGGFYGRGHYRPYHRGHAFRGRYGYGGGFGYGGGYGRGYGRGRLVCRVRHGYHGPVRRCFHVYR